MWGILPHANSTAFVIRPDELHGVPRAIPHVQEVSDSSTSRVTVTPPGSCTLFGRVPCE